MKTLVLGNGLLGTALKEVSKEFTHECVFEHLGWDFTNHRHAQNVINIYQPEVVINTAAKVGGVKLNSEQQEEMFYVNAAINMNLIHCAAKKGVKKFVAFGSICAFDEGLDCHREEDIHVGEPYWKNYGYAQAKRFVEIHLRMAKEQYGMQYSYLIPVTMMGEGDYFNLSYGHVLPSIIHKCYLAKQNKEPLVLWGDGSPVREFVYSQDVARIIFSILDKEVERLLVSSGEQISVREMVKLITEMMGFEEKIVWDTSAPSGQVKRPMVDRTKLFSLLPDFKFTPFQDALRKTVGWFLDNYQEIRK